MNNEQSVNGPPKKCIGIFGMARTVLYIWLQSCHTAPNCQSNQSVEIFENPFNKEHNIV